MAAKTYNNNYWYRATYISPTGHLQEASGGFFALGDVDALDTVHEILATSGDIQGVLIYELLDGGEIGELVASTHKGDQEPRALTADSKQTVLHLPSPKVSATKPDEDFKESTLFDVFSPVHKTVPHDTKLGGTET